MSENKCANCGHEKEEHCSGSGFACGCADEQPDGSFKECDCDDFEEAMTEPLEPHGSDICECGDYRSQHQNASKCRVSGCYCFNFRFFQASKVRTHWEQYFGHLSPKPPELCPQCGNPADSPREDSIERMLVCGDSFHAKPCDGCRIIIAAKIQGQCVECGKFPYRPPEEPLPELPPLDEGLVNFPQRDNSADVLNQVALRQCRERQLREALRRVSELEAALAEKGSK